jgi:hypothetical protein
MINHPTTPPNVVAHNACESSPVRLRPFIGDKLIVNSFREREVRHAGVVDMPNLTTAEPVDGGWRNPKAALSRATPLPVSLVTPGQLSTLRSTIVSNSSFICFLP